MARLLMSALALWCMVPAASANASCSDRPGTPANVEVKLVTGLSPMLVLSFTNTASERVWWDVAERDGIRERDGTLRPGFVEFPHPAGIGRGEETRNLRRSLNFEAPPPGASRCYFVAARTGPNTSGCTSQWSKHACLTVPSASASPPPAPPKVILRLPPSIGVAWSGQVIMVKGSFFTPGAPVTIDVAGAPTKPNPRSITVDVLGALIVADAKGSFARRIDACNNGLQGDLTYTARDKDRGATKSVTLRCRTGFNPSEVKVPPSKLKP